MMRTHGLAALALATLAGSSIALGDPYEKKAPEQGAPSSRPADKDMHDGKIRDQKHAAKGTMLIPMDWAMNKNVYAVGSDDKLGDVNDLLLNAQTGRVEFVIVGAGGLAGIGEREIAVPWQAFTWDQTNRRLHLPMTAEKLGTAPEFNTAQIDTFIERGADPIYKFYGAKRWDNDGIAHGWGERRMTTGARSTTTKTPGTTTTPGTNTASGYAPQGFVLASAVRGKDINQADGSDFGELEELIIDCHSGRLALLIVDIEDDLIEEDNVLRNAKVALPADALRLTAAPNRSLTANNLDMNLLKTSTPVADNDWMDLNSPTYTTGVYRFWSSDPTWLGGDNTTPAPHRSTTPPSDRPTRTP